MILRIGRFAGQAKESIALSLAATGLLFRENVNRGKPLWWKDKTTRLGLLEGSPKNKSVASQEIQG